MARCSEGGTDMLRWKTKHGGGSSRPSPRAWGRARRGQRFNGNTDPERQLVAVGGLQWMHKAADRAAWNSLTEVITPNRGGGGEPPSA